LQALKKKEKAECTCRPGDLTGQWRNGYVVMFNLLQCKGATMKPTRTHDDKRRYPRIEAALPVDFRAAGYPRDQRAITANVSSGGMFIRSQVLPEAGSRLAIYFCLQSVTLCMAGTVAWVSPGKGFGVELTSSPGVWLDFILGRSLGQAGASGDVSDPTSAS
jgi:hypothetical protein